MDTSAPATKADIGMIMDEIGKLHMATTGWKDEMVGRMQEHEDRMKSHFDLVAEHYFHQLKGIHLDKISILTDRSDNHERRLGAVERRLAV